MEKENFELIINNLKARINNCKNYLDDIKTTEDIRKASVETLVKLKAFCEIELKEMTTICMVEFYHIIGMGNLTGVQTTRFIKLLKEYLTYRPDIKVLATNLDSILSLPILPTRTSYKLKYLGNFKLTSNTRVDTNIINEIEDNETTEYYTELKQSTDNTAIGNMNRLIRLPLDKLDSFIALVNTALKKEKVLDCAKVGKCYGGITWKAADQKYVYGEVKSDATLIAVQKYFNNCLEAAYEIC